MCCLLLALPLTACSDPVRVDSPALAEAGRAACEAFIEGLPEQLADEDARDLEPADALGAAYGDPPIVITCSEEAPPEFDAFAGCDEVNGVGWFIPESEVKDPDADVVMSAMSYRPIVQVTVPADYRPNGAAAALAELAEPIKEHLDLADACL